MTFYSIFNFSLLKLQFAKSSINKNKVSTWQILNLAARYFYGQRVSIFPDHRLKFPKFEVGKVFWEIFLTFVIRQFFPRLQFFWWLNSMISLNQLPLGKLRENQSKVKTQKVFNFNFRNGFNARYFFIQNSFKHNFSSMTQERKIVFLGDFLSFSRRSASNLLPEAGQVQFQSADSLTHCPSAMLVVTHNLCRRMNRSGKNRRWLPCNRTFELPKLRLDHSF